MLRDVHRRLAGSLALTALLTTGAVAAGAAPAQAASVPDARVTGRCPHYEGLLAAHRLPVKTFSRIMYRESSCNPTVRSRTRDTGLLQINDVNHRWLSQRLGVRVTQSWLKNPANNVKAAAALYRAYGTNPWRATR